MIGICLAALITIHLAEPRLLVRHATVITCAKGRELNDTDVLIEEGRIKAIGKNLRAIGAQTIDATGKYLIPGLWDMHVHGTSVPGFTNLYLANGVTGIRDMFDPTSATFKIRDNIAAGKMDGPHIIAAGKIVDGDPPIWQGSAVARNAEEGRKAVDQVLKEGSDFVKVYSLLSRDAYFAIADECKEKHAVFAGHVPEVVSAEEASNAGQKSFEHLYGILKSCSSEAAQISRTKMLGMKPEESRAFIQKLLDTYDEKHARKLFSLLKKNKSWQCPTLTVLYSISHPKDPRTDQQDRLLYMPNWMKPFWAQYMEKFKDWTPLDRELRDRYFQKQLEVVGDMYRAGVPILAGTDVMNPYCFPGFSLHDELAWLVRAGLKPAEALRVATINAAKYVGKDKDFGTIERGKVADLVLLDLNPLMDIHNTTKINLVILGGKVFDRAALDKMMPKASALIPSSSEMPAFLGGVANDES